MTVHSILFWLNNNFNLFRKAIIFTSIMNEFKPPKIIFEKSSTEALTIIFEQAKDRLTELIEDAERLYQRSFLIFGTCITLLTGIIGYVFLNAFDIKAIMMSCIGIVLLIVIVKLKENIKPQYYIGRGTEPNAMLNEKLFTQNIIEGKKIEDYILYNEILNYCKRIGCATEKNRKRSERIKESVDLLYCIPGLVLIGSIAFKIISAV